MAAPYDVVWTHGNLAQPARGVADEFGKRDARYPPLEMFHQFDSARDRSAQMAGAATRLGLVLLVRSHARADEAAK